MPFCEADESFLAYVGILVVQLAIQRIADFHRILITENPKPKRSPVAHIIIGVFHQPEQRLNTERIVGK